MDETREFLIVLRILTDDPTEDMRFYPFHDVLAAPNDAPPRHVTVTTAVELKRGA